MALTFLYARRSLKKLLTCRGNSLTLIFITHDMELAVVIADVILVMRNSTLIEQVEFSGDISVFTSEYSKTLLYASGITDT